MRLIYAALPLLLLAGCSSVPAENPTEIPSDRVMAFQEPVQGGGTLYVHRDFGKIGGGCHVALSVDRKAAARIRVGEMVSFQLRPGQHVVGIGIDEQDGAALADWLASWFAPALSQPLRVEDVALYVQSGPGQPFRLLQRYPLRR